MTHTFQNAPNFRAIPPLPTRDGRCLRQGSLYRSGDLSTLAEEEVQQLSAANISLVIDLRSRFEREHRPNRYPEKNPPQVINGDIRIDLRAANGSLGDALRAAPTAEGARQMMHATYQALPQALSPLLKPVVETMIQTPGATLVLCTAGKDRTGTLVASLLYMLQVQPQAIAEDYLQTNARIDLDRMADTSASLLHNLFGLTLPRQALDVVNQVEPGYLDTATQAVRSLHGSGAQWLADAGISAAHLHALREKYLT